MRDNILAERLAHQRRILEQHRGVGQRNRQPFDIGALVGVADTGLGQLKAPLDTVQPSSNESRHRQVLVDITAGNPAFDPDVLPVANHPQGAGAIVQPPSQRRRRETAIGKSLVGVNGRRIAQREFAQRGQLAGDEAAEHRRHAVRPVTVGKHRGAIRATQRDMDVTAITFAFIVFRHER